MTECTYCGFEVEENVHGFRRCAPCRETERQRRARLRAGVLVAPPRAERPRPRRQSDVLEEDTAITLGEWRRAERRAVHFVAPASQRWSAT